MRMDGSTGVDEAFARSTHEREGATTGPGERRGTPPHNALNTM
jgi:hypothetical protein